MAYVQYIEMFLFLLALIGSLEILSTEGRKLQAMKKHGFSFVKIDTGLQNNAKKAINFGRTTERNKDDVEVRGQKPIFPPTPTQSHKLSPSEVSRLDTHRPTTPGNSPGVGHSFAEKKDNMQPKVQVFSSPSVTGKPDDFRATGPGHSPGVGHAFTNSNAGPRA